MKIETIYKKIRVQFENKLMYKDNSYVTKSTRVCYKHGDVDYYVERLKFEVIEKNSSISYLLVKFDAKMNTFRMSIINHGIAKDVETKNEREVYDICLNIIKYSKYEPAEFIEMLYRAIIPKQSKGEE